MEESQNAFVRLFCSDRAEKYRNKKLDISKVFKKNTGILLDNLTCSIYDSPIYTFQVIKVYIITICYHILTVYRCVRWNTK